MLPNGETVESHMQFVWCNTCSRLAWAETLFDAAEINLKLQEIDPQISIFHLLEGKAVPEYLHREELLTQLEFLRIRTSKPKCLTCGGTTWYPIGFNRNDESDFIHSCEGRIYKVPANGSEPRIEIRRSPIDLDVEGSRM